MKTRILIFVFFLFISLSAFYAQSGNPKAVKVRGVVTDASGLPIKKGYVFVDSLKTGFRTNKRGEYKLRIPTETDVISIFSTEYGMQSVVYNGQEEVDFTFSKNNEVITEQELSNLGYLFDVEVFRNIGKKSYAEYTNIFQIIREQFTGVEVDGTSIVIRGSSTLAGPAYQPLFIIDGNYVNSLASVNPDEIKSIELIKGEDAAMYGARGGSGVIIVTLLK